MDFIRRVSLLILISMLSVGFIGRVTAQTSPTYTITAPPWFFEPGGNYPYPYTTKFGSAQAAFAAYTSWIYSTYNETPTACPMVLVPTEAIYSQANGGARIVPTGAYVGSPGPWDSPCPASVGGTYPAPMATMNFTAQTVNFDPGKTNGSSCNCDGGVGNDGAESSNSPYSGTATVGDPVNSASGNKYLQQDDFTGDRWLTFRRFYNSSFNVVSATLGAQWRDSFDRAISLYAGGIAAVVSRPDGKSETFGKTNGVWIADQDNPDVLTEIDDAGGNALGFHLFIAGLRQTENYNATGQLQSITDETGQAVTFTYSGGVLATVTSPEGRKLNFTYNANGQISAITLPDGKTLQYTYDTTAPANLVSVQYPDGSMRQYVYGESSLTGGADLPNVLTGIIDETGTRYETNAYNSSGQTTSSSLAGNVDATQVTYNSNNTSTVQFPLGATTTLGFTAVNGEALVTSVSQPCGPQCAQPWASRTFDANSYPLSSTDFNGYVTATNYDANGLLDQEVDAQGTSNQRTTAITWNTALRVPLTRTVSNANGIVVSSIQWVYNTTGQTLARCEIDPTNSAASGYGCSNTGSVPAGVRRWTYTYCTATGTGCPLIGLMLTATGPRTDLTQAKSYSYYATSSATSCGTPGAACYQAGDLYQVTDALGHVTTVASYDADGRVTRITDANGVNTDMTYTPRGWLASRSVGGATTSFTYTTYGAVQTTTDPDGVTTTYGYDTAHRLIKITDALGNYIQYTLDAAGNKTTEQVYDSSGTLHKSLTRTFNGLGQLTTVIDGLNHTVFNASGNGSYDANGNLVQDSDGLGIQRQLGYDALNRLVQTLDNYNGSDTATQNTRTIYGYDSLDRPTQVTDPSSFNTTYSYDGLGDATSQVSPDTGTTRRSFDAVGNVLTNTDAKGIVATNTYDALDRLITTSYTDSTQNVSYSYDDPNSTTNCATSYPIGRLTRIIENSVTTVYCYDARGNVIQKKQITSTGTDTTSYTITAAGRLSGITYPSGTQVSYALDGDGRVLSLSLTPSGSTASSVVSSVTYQPFGPVASYTLGNGQQVSRAYDVNYRFTDITSTAFNLHVARDVMGDITAIGSAAGADPATETYSYDPLYRLTAVTEASGSVLESVTYNQTGDRLSKTGGGLDIGTYSYNPGTHQLIATGSLARTVDADGNTTAIAQAAQTYGFGYSSRNSMTVAQAAGATVGTYTYNALNERIGKVGAGSTIRFGYDEASRLIGEYGAYTRDYVWLGDIPVAVVDVGVSASSPSPTCFSCIPNSGGPIGSLPKGGVTSSGTTATAVNYVYADGLGTPRVVTNSAGTVIWQWAYQGNAFGELAPVSTGTYALNLRYAGQYFDSETGQVYNVNRYYDPRVGRYIQSDPTGLHGGINTYSYVDGAPLDSIDALGLAVDLNLFKPGTPDWQAAQDFQSDPNTFTVAGHGTPLFVWDQRDGGSHRLTAGELADLMRKSGYKPGQGVALLSCNTGRKPGGRWGNKLPFAQYLADRLDAPVVAPDNWGWFRHFTDGSEDFYVAGASDPNTTWDSPVLPTKYDFNDYTSNMITFYPRH